MRKGADKPVSTKTFQPNEAYNAHLFTSQCCHQFIIHEGASCRCSQCGRLIMEMNDNESLTIDVKYNNSIDINISADIQNAFKIKARRFATDPTCELCSTTCPLCKSYCRYTRDIQQNITFICSNAKCRNVFN